MNGCWGQCVEDYSLRKGTKFFCLEMQKEYPNKKEFLTTLGHEMIHLWQQTIKKDTVIIILYFIVLDLNLKNLV